jgi:hypothetical protein
MPVIWNKNSKFCRIQGHASKNNLIQNRLDYLNAINYYKSAWVPLINLTIKVRKTNNVKHWLTTLKNIWAKYNNKEINY